MTALDMVEKLQEEDSDLEVHAFDTEVGDYVEVTSMVLLDDGTKKYWGIRIT